MHRPFGVRLRAEVQHGIVPFIGVYDVFSASLAARHYDALFISGFSFAASYYGLPDIGFIAWPDLVGFVQRVRTVLPETHLLVDIDDGYGDTEVACHVVRQLESLGASGVVLEDQRRPRRCGHLEGKQILELDEYLAKLERVLESRRDLFVVARTDATAPDEIVRRVRAFARAGADGVLVDGIRDFAFVRELRAAVDCPLAFNQIAGGKSPACTLSELAELGVAMAIYSTPCLFAAETAVDAALTALRRDGGHLPATPAVTIRECNALLQENLERRVSKSS
jgi:2-methylisocitrate lyase-like PEP mutase family enzyme